MSRRTKKPVTSKPFIDPAVAETAPQAFASIQDEIEAVPTTALLSINLDIPRACGRGILAAERIGPLLPVLATLPEFDVRKVEHLHTYALALLHTHDLATEAGVGETALSALIAEAVPLREGLLRSAELLAHFGITSIERVAAIRSGHGHSDTADDLIALGRLFIELWPHVHDKVIVTREMVDRAGPLGTDLHKALAARDTEVDPLTVPTDRRHLRAQAFTLFMHAYDECHRGVAFLRWTHGDAHRIVPSLYPRKSRRLEVVPSDAASANHASDDPPEPNDMLDGDDDSVRELASTAENSVNTLAANS